MAMETANRGKKLNQIVRLALQAGWVVRYGSFEIHLQNFYGSLSEQAGSHTRFGQLFLDRPIIIQGIIKEWFPNCQWGWSIRLQKYQRLNAVINPQRENLFDILLFWFRLLKCPFRKTAVSKVQLLIPYQFNIKNKIFFISDIKSIINNQLNFNKILLPKTGALHRAVIKCWNFLPPRLAHRDCSFNLQQWPCQNTKSCKCL